MTRWRRYTSAEMAVEKKKKQTQTCIKIFLTISSSVIETNTETEAEISASGRASSAFPSSRKRPCREFICIHNLSPCQQVSIRETNS
jgi:hypothetical protein